MENPMKNPELHPVHFLSLVERLDFCEKSDPTRNDFDDNPPTKTEKHGWFGDVPSYKPPFI